MTIILLKLGLIAFMLGLVWLVMRKLDIPTRSFNEERRNLDFYRLYNEMDDKTETMFDRRAK